MDNYNKIKNQYYQMYSGIKAGANTQPTSQTASTSSGWYSGSDPTSWEIRKAIGEISLQDKAKGNELYNQWIQEQSNPYSQYYNKYITPTNRAADYLAANGFNTDLLTNGWLDSAEGQGYIQSNLVYDGATNTPKSPTKKSTSDQVNAYWLNQYRMAEAKTKQVQQEINDALNTVYYWAQRNDLNYSDDKIIDMIYGKDDATLKEKYPTLYEMKNNKTSTLELNSGFDFSEDILRGAIWAARNNGGTGDPELDAIMSAMGSGKVYKEDPSITAKLDANSADYAPYSVGSTAAEVCQHYGVFGFDKNTIANWEKQTDKNDPEQVKWLNRAKSIDEYTTKLETELDAMYADINDMIDSQYSADTIISIIKDSTDLYGDLFELDKTLDTTNLKETARAIDYRWVDIEKKIRDICQQYKDAGTTSDFTDDVVSGISAPAATPVTPEQITEQPVNTTTPDQSPVSSPEPTPSATSIPVPTPTPGPQPSVVPQATPAPSPVQTKKPRTAETAAQEAVADNLSIAASAIHDYGTDEDKKVQKTGGTPYFNSEAEKIATVEPDIPTCEDTMVANYRKKTASTYMGILDTVQSYEDLQKQIESDQEDLNRLNSQITSLEARENLTGGTDNYTANLINNMIQDNLWPEYAALLQSDDPNDRIRGYQFVYGTLAPAGVFDYELEKAGLANAGTVYDWNIKFGQNGEILNLPDHLEEYAEMALNGGVENDSDFQPLTIEEREYLWKYQDEAIDLEGKIEEEQAELARQEKGYKEALSEKNNLINEREYTAKFMAKNGKRLDDTLMDDLEYIHEAKQDWTPPQYTSSSVWEQQLQADESLTRKDLVPEAKKTISGCKNAIESLERGLKEAEEHGIALSDKDKRNIQSRIDALKIEMQSSADFMIDDSPDFEKKSKAAIDRGVTDGMSDLTKANVEALLTGDTGDFASNYIRSAFTGNTEFERQFIGNNTSFLDTAKAARNEAEVARMVRLITDEEKKRYFYLLEDEGEDAANEYFLRLVNPDNGSLQVRASEDRSKELQNFAAQGGLYTAAAYLMSFGTKIAGDIENLPNTLNRFITGESGNPYGLDYYYSQGTTDLRTGVANRLKADAHGMTVDEYLSSGFHNEEDDVIDFFLNAATSAGDSTLNALITSYGFDMIGDMIPYVGKLMGWFEKAGAGQYGGLVKLGADVTKDLAHAIPMGLGAAANTAREWEIKGATPEQIKAIFIYTFLAETISEGVTYGNIKGAFSAGAAGEVGGFIKTLLSNGLEEALGEGFNQWWEDNADQIIGGELSQYSELYNYYHDTLGLPKSVCEELVAQEKTNNILVAAASGFVSSMFSSGQSYIAGTTQQQNKMRAADMSALSFNFSNRATSDTSVVVAGVLQRGGVDVNAAAASSMNIVSEYGKNASASLMRGIVSSSADLAAAKDAVTYASLTKGNANRTLQDIAQKAVIGEQITQRDVSNLTDAVDEDRSGENSKTLNDQYDQAIIANRIAARTRDKMADPAVAKALDAVRKKAENARRVRDESAQKTEQAQDHYDAVSKNADDAAEEAISNPGNKENNGPLEQTMNEKNGAYTDLQEKQDTQRQAEAKAEEATKEEQKTQQDILTEKRAEAEQEVKAEVEQEKAAAAQAEKEAFDHAVALYHPKHAFSHSVNVKKADGTGSVDLTGVYAITPEGVIIYSTKDGYISDKELDAWEDADLPELDAVTWPKGSNPINPKVWLDHSVRAVNQDTGEVVEIVGIEGAIRDGDVSDPVVIDSNGNVYNSAYLGDIESDSYDFLMDAFEQADGDNHNLPSMTATDVYKAVHPDVQMPEGFIAYPSGAIELQNDDGQTFTIVGVIDDFGSDNEVQYVSADGRLVAAGDFSNEPQEFLEWWTGIAEQTSPLVTTSANEGSTSQDTGTSTTDQLEEATYHGHSGVKAPDGTVGTYNGSTVVIKGYFVDGNTAYYQCYDQNGMELGGIPVTSVNVTGDAATWAGQAAIHMIQQQNTPTEVNAQSEQTNQYGFKKIGSMQNKALTSSILGKAFNSLHAFLADGIAIDLAGDLVYTVPGQNSVIEAKTVDMASKPFLEWAINNIEHLKETGNVTDEQIADAKAWLQEQLNDATDNDTIPNQAFIQDDVNNQSTQSPLPANSNLGPEYSEGKVNPKTGEPLKNWQNPKYHGEAKATKVKWNPKSAAFKAWQSIENIPEAARKYFVNPDGSPKLYYRGVGNFSNYLRIVHNSHPFTHNGKTMYVNFYMDKISTAADYAGLPVNSIPKSGIKLRAIKNWESAKAAMQDMGFDLVEEEDPNGSGRMGYRVMKTYKDYSGTHLKKVDGKPGSTTATPWFAENELNKFRKTYGGAPEGKGVYAGYVTATNPLVIDAHNHSYSSVYADVTAPDGTHLATTQKTRKWAKWAFEHGYDAVVFDNVKDNVGGGGEIGVEIVTSQPEMFKSVYNEGKWSKAKQSIMALKVNNKSQQAPQIKSLKELMGVSDYSDQWKSIRQRLAAGEYVSQEELEATPEFKWARSQQTGEDTVSRDTLNAIYKLGGGTVTEEAVEALLAEDIINRIYTIKTKLDAQGSAEFDNKGKAHYTGKVKQEKRLDLLIGLAASGKSTIADYISSLHGSRFLDTDQAKELHPDYRNGLNEDHVHNECKIVNDLRLNEAAKRGDNVLFSVIGNKKESILNRIKPFLEQGYSIHLHMTDLDQNKAIGRVLGRMEETGRFLNFKYLRETDPQAILNAFNELKGGVDGYARWNTDIPKGSRPIPVDYSSEGETDIFKSGLLGRGNLRNSSLAAGGTRNADSSTEGMDNGGSGSGLMALRVFGPKTPTQQQAQKTKAKLKSPQQIAKTLIKSLGFGDYMGSDNFGNLSPAIRAYWDRHGKLVAVHDRDIGDYHVTGHEVGHGIAQMLGIRGTDDMVNKMIAETPEFGQAYTRNQLKDEAMAEFMWRYLESDSSARDFAGDAFVDDFERRLIKEQPGAWKALIEAKNNLREYLNASDSEKTSALIQYERTPAAVPFIKQVKSLIASLADSTAVADAVDKYVGENSGKRGKLRLQALFANHSQTRAMTNLTDSLTDANGTIIGDGLGKALADAGFKGTEQDIRDFDKYCLLLHSFDRDIQNKPVFDSSLSEQSRLNLIDELEKQHPEFADCEAALQTWRHNFLQAWMVDTGYWSQEFLDSLEEMYPHYVPTFRVRGDVDAMESTGFGRSAKKYTLRSATGGSEDIYSPMYSLIGMVNQITSMVGNNQTAQLFDQYYQDNEGMGIFGRQIPGEETTDVTPVEGEMNARQKQLADLLEGEISDDLMEQVLKITKSRAGENSPTGGGKNVLTVQREDGTVVRYEIDSPELYKMLTGAQGSSGIRVLQAIGKLTRTMSMLTTGSNPLFAARNAVRDYQNSVNYGSWASNYLSGIPKWISALAEVAKESNDYKEYQALGGGGWTRIDQNNSKSMKNVTTEMFGDDRSNIGKTLKWAGKKIWNTVTMERVNEIIEQTSRFVEYKYGQHSRNTAEGRKEAFQAAQDVTVDFSRSGNSELAYALKKLVPFFNASMQGVYRTGRQLTEAERSRVGVRLTKSIVNQALASALAAGLVFKFGDDDDKDEFMMLSDGVKANHLVIPNPLAGMEGQPAFLRIPLAQDPVSYAVHNLVTNAMANGSDDEMAISLAATADVILDNLNPLGSGTIFQPFIDAGHNKTWYGSNIVRDNMLDWVDKASQYNEDTPEIFKTMGRLIGESPEVIEYLATQYTGFLGSLAIPALKINDDGSYGGLDSVLRSVINKWTTDASSSNDVTKTFYNMAGNESILNTIIDEASYGRPQGLLLRSLTQDQVDQAYEEAKTMMAKGGIAYETKKLINDTYKKIDQINSNDTLSDAEKYTQTREIKLDMLKQVEAANEELAGYYKKYIQGESLTDRMFGAVRKGFEEGKYAHIKTDVEKMPEVFRNDLDRSSEYMNRVMSVYNGNGEGSQKAAALPHPAQSFTLTLRDGTEQDVVIPDEEFSRYSEIYQREYEQYVMRSDKGKRWDTLTDKEQYDLLKSAAASANKKMKETYARENGIRLKK